MVDVDDGVEELVGTRDAGPRAVLVDLLYDVCVLELPSCVEHGETRGYGSVAHHIGTILSVIDLYKSRRVLHHEEGE